MKLTNRQIHIILQALDTRTGNLLDAIEIIESTEDKTVREKLYARIDEVNELKLAFQLADNVNLTRGQQ